MATTYDRNASLTALVKHAYGTRITPFAATVEANAAVYQAEVDKARAEIRAGRRTGLAAREELRAKARGMAESLQAQARQMPAPGPVGLRDSIEAAVIRRRTAEKTKSTEALLRDLIVLQRRQIIETEISNRQAEFQARAFTHGGPGQSPTRTPAGMLEFLGRVQGDEAAAEWARRQLSELRPMVVANDDLAQQIDAATARPDEVVPSLVAVLVEKFAQAPTAQRKAFLANAVESGDATMCAAAALLALDDPNPDAWDFRAALTAATDRFPEAALGALQDAMIRLHEQALADATALASFAAANAEQAARLDDVPLTEPEIQGLKQAEIAALPVATRGEPIGLRPVARGILPGESFEPVGASADAG